MTGPRTRVRLPPSSIDGSATAASSPTRPLAPLTTFKVGGAADLLVEARSEDELVAIVDVARDARRRRDAARRRIERAGRRRRCPRRRRARPRPHRRPRGRRPASAPAPGSPSTAWCAGWWGRAWPASKPGPERPAPSVARCMATRISRASTSATWCARSASSIATAPSRRCRSRDGLRLRQQPAADRPGEIARVGGVHGRRRGEPEALRAVARASLAYRKRTQPLDVPSAGCIFQNPDPARDGVPDGIPWSAGRARRSRRPQGRRAQAARRCRRCTATSSSATAPPRRARSAPWSSAASTGVAERFGVRCAKRSSTSASSTDRRRSVQSTDHVHAPHRRRPPTLRPHHRRRQQELGAAAGRRLPPQRGAVPARERAAHLGHPRDGRPADRRRRARQRARHADARDRDAEGHAATRRTRSWSGACAARCC